ncbi:hypothetical protein JCM9140_1551 [Halalkalibacter wakoensis JCM 9140]|uniref:Uncharacterized protein n=1 Tax=Halalkalibacter wakoensis JCM 9140 TaxID=1236970 RepID=W4Q0E8_9BACI|nr:hypothetical protein [Halalkalibacter wakoensis]GAE25551.1 hypothetical protein JCM9140_1551 [Halalkalibacter wakoensis JCM 9140]
MNKLAGLNALREISREEFLELAKNGARELFDLAHYKIFDGSMVTRKATLFTIWGRTVAI